MPIYAYKCSNCGFTKDYLQKYSDKPITHCPRCGKETLVKQLSAPGFELKGKGWYATDFKGGSSPALPASHEIDTTSESTTTKELASSTPPPAKEQTNQTQQ